MVDSSSCINDVLPPEILQKILFFSTESFSRALQTSTICRLWRNLIVNPFVIERYWTFDDKHRRKDLVQWWNFDGNVSDQNDSFVNFSTTDCFLGKCVTLINTSKETTHIPANETQYTVDRGSSYTVAFWVIFPEKGDSSCNLFTVGDDDWDYARSTGVDVDEDNYLIIIFRSSISYRTIKSNVKINPNNWFHIALVQERQTNEETPRQKLWINGKIELIVEVPIAAYSSSAIFSFFTWSEWNHSIADLSLWSRCLSPMEIRAIYEQKTSIDKVNITKYIFEHLNN